MFVNMLAIRSFPTGRKSFVEFMNELKEKSIKVFENQDYQFDDLVNRLALPRDTYSNPLFSVNYTFLSMNRETGIDSFREGTFVEVETKSSKFDLSFEATEIGDILSCKFEYKTGLFKRETIRRFIGYFREIISAVIRDKHILLKDIVITHDLLEPEAAAPEMEFKF